MVYSECDIVPSYGERFGDCCCSPAAGLLIRDCGGPGLTATVDFLASSGAAILPPERENVSIRSDDIQITELVTWGDTCWPLECENSKGWP